MAANPRSVGEISRLGKRVVKQICSSPSSQSGFAFRRTAHTSVYDKNFDEHVRHSVVPDEVIQATQSDKYWGPHPKTGVFGPVSEQAAAGGGENIVNGDQNSVMEEKAWFRPTSLEDLEKPNHHH